MKFRHAKLLLLAALGLSLLISLFANRINPYVLFVLCNIGINIILAVSLNLINGYTGQFSLGHAGFMAVGAYTAAVITNQFGVLNGFDPGRCSSARCWPAGCARRWWDCWWVCRRCD